MISMFSWQISVSLCPASFCTPRPNMPVTPGVSQLPTFAFQSPIMNRTSFGGVCSKRSCRSSYNHSASASLALVVVAFLDYCDIEWFALETNRDFFFFFFFEIVPNNSISDSFVDYDGYSISSKGFLLTVVDIMVI